MKNQFIFLIAIQIVIFSPAISQVSDDFADGNFTDLPSWNGETSNFIINPESQLQLVAPAETGRSYLTTSNEIINSAEWSFYVKLDFNPSSSNYMDVYLVSDKENLKESLNGYFVRIGNTQDEISLYKQSGEKSSSIKIIDGTDDRVDVSLVELNIKVTKSPEGNWELLVDTDLNMNYISEGTTWDNDHFFSRYFGIYCNYTSTRSNKFFFDDLLITGEIYVDNDPPEIDSLFVTSDSTMQIIFSESVSEASASDIRNYLADGNIGNPNKAQMQNDSVVILSFHTKFEDKVENNLTIAGIEDMFSNSLGGFTAPFTYTVPYIIEFGDILVTEIMADPTPGVDLPEYEYLEIHNPDNDIFDLNQVTLIVGKDTTTIPDISILPNEYIILCQYSAVEHFEKYGRTVKVSNWPSLNNRGESIVLLNKNFGLVFSVNYTNLWYKSIDKDDGGWSLEMIDTDFPCKGSGNWIASEDPSGGTPGRENASTGQLTDLLGPEILNIVAASDTSIIINLNEKINPQEIALENISVFPALDIENAQMQMPDLSKILIHFNSYILPKTSYELTIKNLHDCAGNVQRATSSTFVLPEKADSLDLLINEILFNPWPKGVDFVELYNQSDKFIDLKTIQIGNDGFKPISTNHHIIQPKQFLAITEDPEILINHYPGLNAKNILKIVDLPPFNNDEGNVILMNEEDQIIDYVRYRDEYHSEFLQDTEGVSLERISFEGASDNPSNWQSAASTSGFATPGNMNSQYFAGMNGSEVIIVEPKVFSPGNNGFQDYTMIKCQFSEPGNIASIQILDVLGRSVKTIISHQSIGSEETFKWEGFNDQGQIVRMGPFIVFVEIYNSTGFKKVFRKKVVVAGIF